MRLPRRKPQAPQPVMRPLVFPMPEAVAYVLSLPPRSANLRVACSTCGCDMAAHQMRPTDRGCDSIGCACLAFTL